MLAGDNLGQLAYLILLLIAVGGWFIAEARGNLGKSTRQFLVWGLIFIGLIAGFGLWGDIRDDIAPRQSLTSSGVIEVPLGVDGHYYLDLELHGTRVEFVVDTGATDIVLTRQDAERLGFDFDALNFGGTAQTANGTVQIASARVDTIQLGDIVDRNFRVSVNGGEMDVSLLGMAYLDKFSSISIRDRRLILER